MEPRFRASIILAQTPFLKVLVIVLAGALLALGARAIFFVTLFEASKLIAGWMPEWAAGKIGLEGVALFAAAAPRCNEGKGAAAIGRILGRLQSGGSGRPFKLHLVNEKDENAFALPGRRIILVTGLLKRARTPEEIAGVSLMRWATGSKETLKRCFFGTSA